MGTAGLTAGARTRPMASLVRRHRIRLVGVTLLLALPGLSTAVLARAQADHYRTTVAPMRDSVNRLRDDLTESLAAYDAFLTSGNVKQLDGFNRARADYATVLDQQDASGPLSRDRVRSLRDAGTAWYAAADRVIADVRAAAPADAAPASQAYARAIEASRAATADTVQVRDEWAAVHDRTLTTGILISLVAAALAGIAGWRVFRSSEGALAAPLHELATVVRAYDSGDWSVRAPTHRGATEVVEVATALNRLAASEIAAREERELSLRMLATTSQVVSELAIAPSEDGHWAPACAYLGAALGADRVVLNTWEDGHFVPLGSWAAPGTPPADFFLTEVHGRGAARVLREAIVASCPDEIAERFPAELADLIRARGGRAWILQPLRVADGVVGVLSVWCLSDRTWRGAELDTVERCGFAAAQTVADARQRAGLHDLEAQKSAFLATTSHELRTPLTSISGYLELLTEGEFGAIDPEQAHALAVVERNVRRLRSLVDDLLILSGLDSGRAITTPERLPIDGVVRDALAEVREEGGTNGVRIEYDGVAPDLVATVNGVHDQLVRALRCVIGNAVKFSDAGDVVHVSAEVEPDTVVVTCRDEGVGIPAAEVGRVFARFYRASNATRAETPGTGLGLSITKAVVEGHGGHVSVESVEDSGTTVVIRLPLAQPVGVVVAGWRTGAPRVRGWIDSGPYDEGGAARLVRQGPTHRTEQQAGEAAHPPAADHEQRGGRRRLDEHRGGPAPSNGEVHGHAGGGGGRGELLEQLRRLGFDLQLVLAEEPEGSVRRGGGLQVPGVDGHEPALQGRGGVDGGPRNPCRGVRAVEPHDDGALGVSPAGGQHDHGSLGLMQHPGHRAAEDGSAHAARAGRAEHRRRGGGRELRQDLDRVALEEGACRGELRVGGPQRGQGLVKVGAAGLRDPGGEVNAVEHRPQGAGPLRHGHARDDGDQHELVVARQRPASGPMRRSHGEFGTIDPGHHASGDLGRLVVHTCPRLRRGAAACEPRR
jgi:two-component system phosphate regulon sensor histidine kinase PhoR